MKRALGIAGMGMSLAVTACGALALARSRRVLDAFIVAFASAIALCIGAMLFCSLVIRLIEEIRPLEVDMNIIAQKNKMQDVGFMIFTACAFLGTALGGLAIGSVVLSPDRMHKAIVGLSTVFMAMGLVVICGAIIPNICAAEEEHVYITTNAEPVGQKNRSQSSSVF